MDILPDPQLSVFALLHIVGSKGTLDESDAAHACGFLYTLRLGTHPIFIVAPRQSARTLAVVDFGPSPEEGFGSPGGLLYSVS